MSLDAILDTIRQSAAAAVREIEARARDEGERILAQGRTDADAIRQEARKAAARATTADRARIIHHAHLEAMQIVGHAEQAIVATALERAKTQLAAFRAAPEYPDLLRHLVDEALGALQGSLRANEPVHLRADPRDRDLLAAMLRAMQHTVPREVQVSYDLATWGGIQVASSDNAVGVDNTLEARLAFAAPMLQRVLPAWLENDATPEPQAPTINTESPAG